MSKLYLSKQSTIQEEENTASTSASALPSYVMASRNLRHCTLRNSTVIGPSVCQSSQQLLLNGENCNLLTAKLIKVRIIFFIKRHFCTEYFQYLKYFHVISVIFCVALCLWGSRKSMGAKKGTVVQ